jgi:hypothetical protein
MTHVRALDRLECWTDRPARRGREICGRLELWERREWLCSNGLSGIASDTLAESVRAWMEIASSSEPRA